MADKRNLEATYKSSETEEWFDTVFNRPIGFWWARLFDRWDVHPNTVTFLSIILGALGGMCFFHTDLWWNVAGVLLLTWANFYDSADGQLARMTGKKTRLGRILDGFSADVWFYIIYFCLCCRLSQQPIADCLNGRWWHLQLDWIPREWHWTFWPFLISVFSGLMCHRYQCSLADYYRNIHLFFLKGEEGSELDNFAQQREILHQTPLKGNFWWRAFLWGYGNYTRQQEGVTPEFQQFRKVLKQRYGSDVPVEIREEFLKGSRPLMKWTNILTHNTRVSVLFLGCVLNIPVIYFLFEMTVLNVILWHMHHSHEALCRRLCMSIEK